jgi:hypothetical protein
MPRKRQRTPPRGTGRAYLLYRLQHGGHAELLAAVRAGKLSVYAAACEVGIVKRPTPSGAGSPNMAKRRAYAIAMAFVDAARGL